MKLSDIKDENGTSLQSHADVFLKKADSLDQLVIMLFPKGDGTLSVMHNTANIGALPDVLSQLASAMRKQPKAYESRNKLREDSSSQVD